MPIIQNIQIQKIIKMEESITKYQVIIDGLKDGQSVTLKRDTVLKGKKASFGTITRSGNTIKYQPSRGMRGYAESWADSKAAQRLSDLELLAAFSF